MLIIHVQVSQERTGNIVDAKCRQLTASFVRDKNDGQSDCDFFNVRGSYPDRLLCLD